jgi:predicted membrane protein
MNVDPNLNAPRNNAGQDAVAKARAAVRRGPLVTAIVVIIVGVVLLLDQLGYVSVDFWPLVFGAAGVVLLLSGNCWSQRLWGSGLLLAAIMIALNERGITHIRFWQLWPLYIIVAGVGLLWNAMTGSRTSKFSSSSSGKSPSSPRFNSVYVFSGTDRKITTKDFEGGRISAIFGGFKIDLSRADIAGDVAVIEVNAVFGGGEIIVPEQWVVVVEGGGVFGAFEDKTRHIQSDASQPDKTLIVKGSAIFGGIVVKNW